MYAGEEGIIQWGNYSINLYILILSCFVTLLLVILAVILSKSLQLKPVSKLQVIAEMLLGFLEDIAVSTMGERGKEYIAWGGSIFLFVLFSNWLGLIPKHLIEFVGLPIEPPTSNINTPLALAILSIIYYNYTAIKKMGVRKYFIHYLGPVPLLARSFGKLWWGWLLLPPLSVLFLILSSIEHISRCFSLTVRLFCNMMGEHAILGALIAVVLQLFSQGGVALGILPIVIPIPLIVMIIGLITGFVQAFIFMILNLAYIGSFVAEEH